ncbi:glycoside hydrolase family 2 TIM barrel-domain containing protein [Sphingobacterium chuzhouense]|uniref:Glycoside hydrolase family 2 protein n=1 Tax=Sphingobacterium chuzhouense TaxID=1742264 RepID=A0ABR7XNS3_9SPHI|nr:glycoside hydrolase family 2 TIM barrel-domain containing protein [Sphingobacterium chuzhouense]MBD1420818.1 glycoside hydrolase family 2 protein [Sphingobacterium chuzhouense]
MRNFCTRKLRQLCSLILTCSCFMVSAQEREEILLDDHWKFSRDDEETFSAPLFDDAKWQTVSVPHDWAIYGPFSIHNDKQHTAITQDGQKEALEHAGRTGGLPFVGTGWYRRKITLGKDVQDKRSMLQFDGAMSNAVVFVNGKRVGNWPNGYNSFYFDISAFVVPGENVIAVRLENLSESSRWYPGAGLYRNVHLILSNKTKIAHWGTYITTPHIEADFAEVSIKTQIDRQLEDMEETLVLRTEVFDQERQAVGYGNDTITPYDSRGKQQTIFVSNPKLWSPDTPTLYTAVSKLYVNGELKDTYETPFGIRSIEIIPNKGFYLNGEKTVFKGVCMHHDLGPLGAAVNESAIRRQIRILKDMGVNAIRTSHNMPAPEFVKACDEMGMMVMAESFDEWKLPKVKNGYNLYFDEWAEKDLVNLIHHYRNNPSIVMWCIGNEVPEQASPEGSKVARFLQDICHREDPTRPVTQGMDNPDAVINSSFASTMDVAGFNYRPFKYREAYKKLQQQIILGSETASTISSRGVYKFPVVRRSMAKYDDHQASSYDVEHCSWSDLPEDNFIQHEDLPYAIGEFVWTGFDYLGEPTPYYTDWPSHSSLFGIVDLAGIPKDRYYLYRSHWNTKEKTLHILPHWSWPGREGDTTPVFVYTNYPKAELFINGKSQGIQSKDLSVTRDDSADKQSLDSFVRQKRYRLMWMDTRYEPGVVKVVAYDAAGHIAAVDSVVTAGKPYGLKLEVDRPILKADGKDLAYITISVVDQHGILCPMDDREISFTVKGKGNFKAVANGNPASLESFQAPKMKAFSGKLVAVLETTKERGEIIFEASAKGVKKAMVSVRSE